MPILAILFLTVPIAELAVIITVGQNIGVFETLAALILISVVGAWLAKQQGLGVLNAVRNQLERGQVPGAELVDGLLILVAGAFLLTPGFITDAVALALLLPPVRAGARGYLRRRFFRTVETRGFRVVEHRTPPQDHPPSRYDELP